MGWLKVTSPDKLLDSRDIISKDGQFTTWDTELSSISSFNPDMYLYIFVTIFH